MASARSRCRRSHPPPQLFELFRALADQPGADDVPSRLAAAGVDRIRVTLASPEPPAPPSQPLASPEDVESREAIIPRESRPTGTDGILRGEPWRDTKSVPISGVPLVSHDPPPPPATDALPGTAGPARPAPGPRVWPNAARRRDAEGQGCRARTIRPDPPVPRANRVAAPAGRCRRRDGAARAGSGSPRGRGPARGPGASRRAGAQATSARSAAR